MKKEEVIEILERFVIGAKPCSQREIVDACASAYRMLKEQPSLPSNLDEAAEKIASDIAPTHPDIDWDECFEKIKDGIKAGAQWMAGQGCTVEIDEGYFINNPHLDKFHKYYSSVFDHSKKITVTPGDNLVVQIRKK